MNCKCELFEDVLVGDRISARRVLEKRSNKMTEALCLDHLHECMNVPFKKD